MKIAMFHGQSHKQISYHIGKNLVDTLSSEEVYEFFLPKDMPHFCNGCCRCLHESIQACPHHTEMKPLLDAMELCDLLIFTTPVYCYHTSASMKAFLDHCFIYWLPHRPQVSMFKKKAVIVSVGAGTGMKKAAKDIKDSLFYWGISDIYTITQRGLAPSWDAISDKIREEIDKKVKRVSSILIRNKQSHVSLKIKVVFHAMRMMHKKNMSGSEVDTTYWKEKGWLQTNRPWSSK